MASYYTILVATPCITKLLRKYSSNRGYCIPRTVDIVFMDTVYVFTSFVSVDIHLHSALRKLGRLPGYYATESSSIIGWSVGESWRNPIQAVSSTKWTYLALQSGIVPGHVHICTIYVIRHVWPPLRKNNSQSMKFPITTAQTFNPNHRPFSEKIV